MTALEVLARAQPPIGEPARGWAAIWYARRLGWPIFPCTPGDKTPLIRNPAKWASRNPAVIAKWWERWPRANPATPAGPRSRFFAVDVDRAEGEQSLIELQARHGPLPDQAPMQITGSGNGRQILLRWPRDRIVRSSASKVADHVDIRGRGGHIVLPPSIHPSGGEYIWVPGHDPTQVAPPPAPAWLLDLVDPTKAANDDQAAVVVPPEPGIPEGRRDVSLFAHLKDHAEHCAAFEELLAFADSFNARCRPPNDPARVRLTARSVWYRYFLTGNIWRKGGIARVQTRKDDFDLIKAHPDAVVLEMELRFAHAARDEPFALVSEAMARDQPIPGWGWRRYRNARDKLLELGRIEQIAKGGRRRHDPNLYRLRWSR
jgi:hypothetical protein